VLYVAEERIPEVWPNVVAPGWGDDVEPDVEGARKFESLGQRDDAALAAVGTTVDFHRLLGPERIEARIHELSALLKAGLKDMGLTLVTPEDQGLSGGVCVIKLPPERRQEIVDRLYVEHGIGAAGAGGLRLCPHIYNTMAHLKRALEGVRALRERIV
jgi:selenocysteine lyase/cysteine desulfurase